MYHIKNLTALFFAMAMSLSYLHSQIVVKTAAIDDCEAITQFIRHAYETHFKTIYTNGYTHMAWGQNPDHFINLKIPKVCDGAKDLLERQSQGQDYCALVAYEEVENAASQLKGVCLFYKKDPGTVHIKFLFIDEAYRGKGIGKKMLTKVLNTYEQVQACTLFTLAFANDGAHSFYNHLGFINTGPATIDPDYPNTHVGYFFKK